MTSAPESTGAAPLITVDNPAALAALVADAAGRGTALVDYGVAHAGLGHAPPARHQRFALRAPDTGGTGSAEGVIEHYQRDFAVRVSAGATLGAVLAALRPQGQFLPLDADLDLTIGEAIAHNVYGPLRLGYGALRNLLLGLSYIDGLGREVRAGGRTVKNVAGYDLTRFMVGSLGQFGIIHEATIRTYAIPESVLIVDVHADDLVYLDAHLTEWLASDAVSTHMYLRWEEGRWLVRLGYFGALRGCAVQMRALEELLEHATNVRLAGTQNINLDEDRAQRVAHRAWRRSPEVSAVVKVLIPPAVTGRVCQTILDWARGAGVEPPGPCINATPAHGKVVAGGRLSAAQALSLDQTIRATIDALGGARLWVRRPGDAPAIEPFYPAPTDLAMLVRLKKAMDPRGIFNPGRFVPVGGTGGGA
jgi:glycolate oxidase FAD binding subunit